MYKSFLCALRGLKTVWNEELNFRIEIIVAVLVLISIFYFKFSYIESALSILVIVLVLGAEIVNTVIEDLCNKVEPRQDLSIAKIKDMMASFVLIVVIGAVILGIIVFSSHFL
ncbi:MAG: diacylglycerol kinase family protein [Patescibacteria group bacterium]